MAILEELQEEAKQSHVSAYEIATAYMGFGDKEQAFAWFERACEERAGWLVFLKSMPRYDSLRDDPRFHDLVGSWTRQSSTRQESQS
jgi:hypothetical protein